jgi:preprotein translocase subunit SecF
MNKYYVIVPAALLIGFIFVYRGAVKDMDTRDAHLREVAAEKAANEENHRKELEKKAQIDAAKQQKIRDDEEQAKLDKEKHDYDAAMTQLKTEADGYAAESDKLQKESNQLDLDITKTRELRDKTTAEAFDLTKQVELEKINRRNAELEIQRLVEMVGKKAADSTLAAMPPPPPPPPPAK